MTTPVKQLKDTSGNNFYPQTARAAIPDLTPIQTNDIDASAVTTAKIADGAVTSAKLAPTILTGTIPTGTNTIDLSAGQWLIFAYISLITPTDKGTPGLILKKNGSEVRSTYAGNMSSSTWENLALFDYITVESGDTIALVADTSSSSSVRSRYIAIKIG